MKNKNWTKSEIKIIKENYPIYGLNGCLDKLNRTKRAIQLKRKELNIPTKLSIKNKWKKENLLNVISNSLSYYDCLVQLGINNKGSSYNTLKKYIKLYNINIDHFDKNHNIKKMIKNNTIDLKDILIENSTYKNRTRIKERLYKEGLKERICEKCGQDENWNGEKITLILDHINGINNDNRLENLRILCPNCNATLPTHCKGNKRLYDEKQKQIINKKQKHKKYNNELTDKQLDNNIDKRKVKRPPYEQLINEIKELGYRGTGRKYNVSDNAIRKWKKHYEKIK